MRFAVLDVGANSVHLVVMDARRGEPLARVFSYKTDLRLAENVDERKRVTEAGARDLERLVAEADRRQAALGCEAMAAVATSSLREAGNGRDVVERVRARTGVELTVLTGPDEAGLTFLAVRRWFGWSAGRLLALDLGGGSMEIAIGEGEEPDHAVSLPLGAGRLTRERLTGDPPAPDQVAALRAHVRAVLEPHAGEVLRRAPFDLVAATSKTFRQLARLCGAAPASAGPYVVRTLAREDLRARIPELARTSSAQRATLRGVSRSRAPQILAGALVAEAALDVLEIAEVRLCPWALREGVVLRSLDALASGPEIRLPWPVTRR